MVNLKQYLSPSPLSRKFQLFFISTRSLRSSHFLYYFRPNHPVDGPVMILPSPLPKPAKRPKLVISQPSSPSTPLRVQKRPAPDNVDEVQPAKRARIATPLLNHSPSKSRRLEEDGLILLDGNRSIEEDIDIVVID